MVRWQQVPMYPLPGRNGSPSKTSDKEIGENMWTIKKVLFIMLIGFVGGVGYYLITGDKSLWMVLAGVLFGLAPAYGIYHLLPPYQTTEEIPDYFWEG